MEDENTFSNSSPDRGFKSTDLLKLLEILR